MADGEENDPGKNSGLVQEFIDQLRGIAEKLEGLSGVGVPLPPVSALRNLPVLRGRPALGALSAEQVRAIATAITAQRRSIEALKTQLTAFDEQLAVLERIVGPLADWTRRWAEVEDWLLRTGRAPGRDHKAGGS